MQSILLFFSLYFVLPLGSVTSRYKKIGRGVYRGGDESLQNLVVQDVILHNSKGEG